MTDRGIARWFRRVPGGLLALCLIMTWFNSGNEDVRNGDLGDIPEHYYKLFVPPWRALRVYVSRSSDEQLFWQYSRLVLGEAPDLDYLAEKRQGDPVQNRAEIARMIRPSEAVRLPYRDFAFEYPPVPIALMLLPRLFVDSLSGYRVAYGISVAVLTLLTAWLGVLLCRDRAPGAQDRSWSRITWLVLAIGPLVVSRFDILPALLVVAALLLFRHNRPAAAGICLGIGALAKLYPLLLLVVLVAPLLAEHQRRTACRMIVGAVVAMAAIAAPFLWCAPEAFLRSTFIYGERPFQVESAVGALALLIRGKGAIVGSFGSYNVRTAGWLEMLGSMLLPLAVLACAGLAARQARRRPSASRQEQSERQLLWAIATLGCVLLTSKVLSPQFLIWLSPLAALTPDLRTRRWLIAAAALTQVFYPFLYDLIVHDANRLVILIVLARNAMLVVATGHAVRYALQHGPTVARQTIEQSPRGTAASWQSSQ